MNKLYVYLICLFFFNDSVNAQYGVFFSRDTISHTDYFTVNENIMVFLPGAVDDTLGKEKTRVRSYYMNYILKEDYCTMNDFKDGEYRSYYPNGALYEYYNCTYGNKNGVYIKLYSNGKREMSGVYTLNSTNNRYLYEKWQKKIVDSLGRLSTIDYWTNKAIDIKDGTWLFWDSTGKQVRKEIWDNGELKHTIYR